MVKAIIFDFDGVIVNSEPVHFKAFQTVLSEIEIEVTRDDYYEKYLAYDDKTFFYKSLNDFGKYKGQDQVEDIISRKSKIFNELIENNIEVFPGVKDFIKLVGKNYRIAIGSGALRKEIEYILKSLDLLDYFEFIISADDVIKCKPHPEVYIKVLRKFNELSNELIDPSECVVFEDAPHGIQAAKSAGMKCIGVTNSNSPDELYEADLVIDSFLNFDLKSAIAAI